MARLVHKAYSKFVKICAGSLMRAAEDFNKEELSCVTLKNWRKAGKYMKTNVQDDHSSETKRSGNDSCLLK